MQQAALPVESVVSIGVDWLTCTFLPERHDRFVRESVDRLMCNERKAGNIVHNWEGMGYKGRRCGQMQFGVRHDSTLVRLSGDCARLNWRPLAHEAWNISRLDLQVTSRIEGDVDSMIARHHSQAKRAKRRRGRGPTLTLIRNDT
jgi:hypothetical protein